MPAPLTITIPSDSADKYEYSIAGGIDAGKRYYLIRCGEDQPILKIRMDTRRAFQFMDGAGAKVLNFEGVIKKSRTDIIAQAGPVNSNQRFPDPFSSCYRYNIDIDDFIRGSSRIIHAKKFQLLSICSSAAIQPAAPLPQTVVDLSQVDLSHIEEDYRKSWKDTYCLDKAGLIFRWSGYLAVSTTALISGLGTANEIDPVTANLISTILTAGGGVLVWMGKSFDKHAVKSYETYKDLHTRQGLPAVTIRPYVNWEIEDPNGAKKTAV